MKVKDAAKHMIAAKEQGEEAVLAQLNLFIQGLMDDAVAKMKPGSPTDVYLSAMREADTRWQSLTLRVQKEGINLEQDRFRKMVMELEPVIAQKLGWV